MISHKDLDKKSLPCPFCGNKFEVETYDRGIIFGCKTCNYSRSFKGIVNTDVNDNPIMYKKQDGSVGLSSDPKNQEYLHNEAYELALNKVNQRWYGEDVDLAMKVIKLKRMLYEDTEDYNI